jgi:Flp pilus assembly protein TadD
MHAEAENHFKEALRLRYDEPRIHIDYAVLLREEAEGHLRQALELEANGAETYYAYANLMRELLQIPCSKVPIILRHSEIIAKIYL